MAHEWRSEDIRFVAVGTIYMIAIAVANGLVSRFGPAALPFTAVLMIGLDLTCRDFIHDYVVEECELNPFLIMPGFLLGGALINWKTGTGDPQIVLWSSVTLLVSGFTDTGVYHLARDSSRTVRVLTSNFASALVDSTLFPLLAFGAFLPWLVVQQTLLKFVGGAVWLWILKKR